MFAFLNSHKSQMIKDHCHQTIRCHNHRRKKKSLNSQKIFNSHERVPYISKKNSTEKTDENFRRMRVNAGPDTVTGWFGAIFGLGPVEKCQQSGGNGLVRWSNQQSTRKRARETPRSPAWTTFDAPKTVAEPLPLLSFSLFVGRCRREPWAKPTATTANATVSEISCCRRRRLEEPLEEVCPDRDCANLLHFGVKLICPRELPENLIPSPPPLPPWKAIELEVPRKDPLVIWQCSWVLRGRRKEERRFVKCFRWETPKRDPRELFDSIN